MNEIDDNDIEHFAETLGQIFVGRANALITAKRAEKYFSPRIPTLAANKKDGERINKRLEQLTLALGGPPQLLVSVENESPRSYDTFAVSAIYEMVEGYWKARRRLVNVHLIYITLEGLRVHPEYLVNLSENELPGLLEALTGEFWDAAEDTFTRIFSYWERVAQLLNFVFFHVRQHEDGFHSVIEKIRANYAPFIPGLVQLEAWQQLRGFETSEEPNGFGWLARRRNLIVHKLSLSHEPFCGSEEFYSSFYNQLTEAFTKKLKKGSYQEELTRMHQQMSVVVDMFGSVLDLAIFGAHIFPRLEVGLSKPSLKLV